MEKAFLRAVPIALLTVYLCLPMGSVRALRAQRPPLPPQSRPVNTPDSAASTGDLSSDRDKLGPIGVFADIEEGWRTEKSQQILQHYGRGKVTLSIAGTGPTGGEFSRNQSHYLFQDLFKYTITTSFAFVQYRMAEGQDRVYAVAERSYKKNDDGRLFKDKIYVALHLENDRWVISEIKSIR